MSETEGQGHGESVGSKIGIDDVAVSVGYWSWFTCIRCMRACSHAFNLSLSSSYSGISGNFSDKWMSVAEAVNGVGGVRVNKDRMKAESWFWIVWATIWAIVAMAWGSREAYMRGAVATGTGKGGGAVDKVNETLGVSWVAYKAWIWACSSLNRWRVAARLLATCWANASAFRAFSEVFSGCSIELRWGLYRDRVAARWKCCLKLLVFRNVRD